MKAPEGQEDIMLGAGCHLGIKSYKEGLEYSPSTLHPAPSSAHPLHYGN